MRTPRTSGLFFLLLAVIIPLELLGQEQQAYVLKARDTISFEVREDRQGPKQIAILDSGEVQIPYLGLVRAAGLTPEQLRSVVTAGLEERYFQNATVSLTVAQIWVPQAVDGMRDMGGYGEQPYVTIFGQVGRQGRIPLPYGEELSISEAVLRAGGFARFAEKKKVKIIRRVGSTGNTLEIIVDVDRIMRRGDLDRDIPLRADDTVIVGEKLVNF